MEFPRVNAIISTLEELGLSLQNLRGQGYDGAATMSVEKSSVSSPPYLQKIHRRHIHHLDPQSRSIRQLFPSTEHLPSKHHLHQTHITQRSNLTIYKDPKDTLQFNLYAKPTSSHQYVHADSHPPAATKRAITYAEALRVIRNCSDHQAATQQLQTLKHHFRDRGYNSKTINKLVNKF